MADALQLRDEFNHQTAKIAWQELEPLFARGRIIQVADGMDLVDVAVVIATDQVDQVSQWMESGQLRTVSDTLAHHWHNFNPQFWAVVVAPWVLIQAPKDEALA